MDDRRDHGRAIRSMGAALAIGLAVACVPQPTAPALPAGTGFGWVRDVGGTTDGNGNYQESYSHFTLLDGVTGGPTPVTTPFFPLVATAGPGYASFGGPVFPDGTAKFPWNGFAGEGITTATSTSGGTTTYDVSGPGGTCRFTNVSTTYATIRTSAAVPSPDGTKLAVYSRLNDADASATVTYLSVYALDATCNRLANVTYRWSSYAGSISGDMIVSSLTVWSPDSSAILFPLTTATAPSGSRLLRLGAAAGSTPTIVLDAPTSAVLPLGWSPSGRVLVVRTSRSTSTPPVGATSLETLPIGGGHTKVFDVQTSTVPPTRAEFHVGYFVPGTSQILYSGGTRTATAPGGRVVAWPQFRIHDDGTDADAAVPGADAPLTWHTTPSGDTPNGEYVERSSAEREGTHMTPQRPTRRARRASSVLLLGVALAASLLTACVPAVGLSAPFYGDAVYNPATTNYEGRMTACNLEGGPVTVIVEGWGVDVTHPFLVEVTDASGTVISSRSAVGPDDALVTQPLLRGACFGVRITTPNTTNRGYFSYTVIW
jgi:hypothetical protein